MGGEVVEELTALPQAAKMRRVGPLFSFGLWSRVWHSVTAGGKLCAPIRVWLTMDVPCHPHRLSQSVHSGSHQFLIRCTRRVPSLKRIFALTTFVDTRKFPEQPLGKQQLRWPCGSWVKTPAADPRKNRQTRTRGSYVPSLPPWPGGRQIRAPDVATCIKKR